MIRFLALLSTCTISLVGCQLLLGIDSRAVNEAPDGGSLEGGPRELPDGFVVDGSRDALADVPSQEGGAFAVRTGDIVVLEPSSIQTGTNGGFEAWKDRTNETRKATAWRKTTSPSVTQEGTESCVAFQGGDFLAMDDDGSLDPGSQDFSVLAIVKPRTGANGDFGSVPVARAESIGTVVNQGWRYSYRGFALMTEHSRVDNKMVTPRFAARLHANYESLAVDEVVEPRERPSEEWAKVTATALQRIGGKVYLHVGEAVHEASAEAVQPKKAALLIGKVDIDDDYVATAYKGLVCAVVLHHGPETTAAVQTRLKAMRLAFPP